MFTFFLVVVVVYSLALFNNCEWEKENKKSRQNQHFDIPDLVLWELEKLESQWTILFSQVLSILCSRSAPVASRLEQLHCKKWNNRRLFFASILRLREETTEEKKVEEKLHQHQEQHCVMQFCLCCTNKGITSTFVYDSESYCRTEWMQWWHKLVNRFKGLSNWWQWHQGMHGA